MPNLTERDFSPERRRQLARQGLALPDGSFPIVNRADLRNAIQAFGRAADKQRAKRHITKRARALGAVSDLPDDWNVSESHQPEHTGGVMHLRETTATSLSEAAVDQGGNVLLRLIAPGWSKNGRYYPEGVLKSSGLKAFREGTQTYLDHPSRSDEIDRPERSVRDLVGSLNENAYYDPSGPEGPGLYARASVREEYRPLVDELAESIGMSIRADGTGHHGEAEGKQGTIIDTIESADSVDYVTSPAAGGKVIQLLESVQNPQREVEPVKVDIKADVEQYVEAMRKAGNTEIADKLQEARNIGQWLEARLHSMFTEIADGMYGDGRLTRDERMALSGAIGDALTAFTSRAEADAPDVFTRDLFENPELAATEMSESTDETSNTDTSSTEASPTPPDTTTPKTTPADTGEAGTNAAPSAPTTVQESEEDDMTGTPGAGTAPQQTPRSLMEAEITNMRRENAELRARERARGVIAGVLSEGWLVPAQIATLTESLLQGLPLTDDLQLNETELVQRATTAREREELVGFQVSEALGVGRPRDVGPSATTDSYETPNYESELTETFRSIGMSESAAKIAAKGR